MGTYEQPSQCVTCGHGAHQTGATSAGLAAQIIQADTRRKEHLHKDGIA